ncbi:hypothetical protein [Pectobacterium aroidearum]|uniref:hypothetical protein n=1 Tax=Pectobacterium aroidearum TaxID=1201031 RepID=UPI0033076B9D
MKKIVIAMVALGFQGSALAYPYATTCSVEHIIIKTHNGISYPEVEKSTAKLIAYKDEDVKRVEVRGLVIKGVPTNIESPPLSEFFHNDGFREWSYLSDREQFIYYYTSNWLYVEFGGDLKNKEKTNTTDKFLIRNCQ